MTFPSTPLVATVELLIGGTWTDITARPVYRRDTVRVARGSPDEATAVERSTCRFTVNNRDGNLSPRNPTGTYYGQIGRNTPCRVRLTPAPPGYVLTNFVDEGAETPDSASLSITGDIDIRIDVSARDWNVYGGLCNKLLAGSSTQTSWSLSKQADGTLRWVWTTDGSTQIQKLSTTVVTVPASGRLALRVTLDVDNGAVGNDVKFYTAPQITRDALLSGDTSTFDGSVGTWGASGSNTTVDHSTVQAHNGAGSMRLTSIAAGNISARSDNAIAANRFDVTAGDEYPFEVWSLAGSVARSNQVLVNWYNGTTFLSTSSGPAVPNSTIGWTKIPAVFTAPATATRGALFVQILSTGGAGEIHYIDDAQARGGTTWTQLGATVTTAGTTSIFDSTAPVQIGRSNLGIGLVGRVYAFHLYQGIAGTLRADVNMSDEEAGEATFIDDMSNTWTVVNDASIVNPKVRFRGEISVWPQRWEVSGRDVYVPIEASGILRRLTQGASALKSTLYRGLTSATFTPKAYWPCEDAADATVLASAFGGPPMQFAGAQPPSLSAFTSFKCSAPLPTLQDNQFAGVVPDYTGTGNVQVWFLLHVPTGAATINQAIIHVYTTGTVSFWRLEYAATDGGLVLKAFAADGTQLMTSGTVGFAINDKLLRMEINLVQNGANIDWRFATLEVGALIGSTASGTLNSQTISKATRIYINGGGGLGNDIAVGHISVHDSIRNLFDLFSELAAYVGERAGRRIARLCAEETISFRGVGDIDATMTMGPQLPAELVSLLREAADADMGILYEPRDMFGLAYRTRDSLCHQAAALELDYAANHLGSGQDSPGIDPVDDDQHVRNDITCRRSDGSSVRAVQTDGPLSISAPPAGVGRYDTEVALNLESDAQLVDAAGWLLHLGTVDEARYPVLLVDLARAPFVASSTLALAVQDLDVGDRLTISNPPAWLPPDDISLLGQGFTETMSNFEHRVEVNCSPESPWGQAAIYDDGVSRYSSDGSTLAAAITTTTATSISVATPSGPLWSHADGDFDIRVGGEVMTVTAVSGASSPQTFTVTRSVNGVQKTHPINAAVELAHPRVYVP